MRPPATRIEVEATTGPVPPHRAGLAWGVHLLTASGGVVGTLALVAIVNGRLATSAALMLLALVIDSVDGTLARAVKVSQVLPEIDGRRLDDMVDFLNYVIVPVVFMVVAGSIPHWGAAIPPVLASCYGFAHVAAKTEDDYFRGFPSYWNVVAIYAWGMGVPPAIGAWIVAILSVMVFVPIKYAYPSKLPVLRTTTAVLGLLWAAVLVLCVLAPERGRGLHLLELSLAYPAYYLALSFWLQTRTPTTA